MKSWLLHNFWLKLFSVLLATVIWWLVNHKINHPFQTGMFDDRIPTRAVTP